MRLWYWFLLILFFIGLALLFSGQYYILNKEYGFGWELLIYGAVIFGFLLAVGFLYFERWRRRWWRS